MGSEMCIRDSYNAQCSVDVPAPVVNSSIATASAWRLWTREEDTDNGKWDVKRVRFFSASDCSDDSEVDTSLSTGRKVLYSKYAGSSWPPKNAFTDPGIWGGRAVNGYLWIGMDFGSEIVTIRCVNLTQTTTNKAFSLYVQARMGVDDGSWISVGKAEGISKGSNIIQFVPPIPSLVRYLVVIKYDSFPWQTSWVLKDVLTGSVIASSRRGEIQTPKVRVQTDVPLVSGTRYKLILKDSAGDGFCCGSGRGFARVVSKNAGVASILFTVKATFDRQKGIDFVVP